MVKDPYMQGEIESLIKSGQCVEYAVSKICDSFISMFSSVDDELTNQRATDVLDIKNSLLAILLNIEEINLKDAPPETVVVADVLTPSMTSGINSENIVGIITENGGATSHSSIIARALGIPAVLSVDNALQNIKMVILLLLTETKVMLLFLQVKQPLQNIPKTAPIHKTA